MNTPPTREEVERAVRKTVKWKPHGESVSIDTLVHIARLYLTQQEELAVLRSQVENADVNLEQQKLITKRVSEKLLQLEVVNGKLWEALQYVLDTEEKGYLSFCGIPSCKKKILEALSTTTPNSALETVKKMVEALEFFVKPKHDGDCVFTDKSDEGCYLCVAAEKQKWPSILEALELARKEFNL